MTKTVIKYYPFGEMRTHKHAGVAELADAQDSGSCGGNFVKVQVLSPAPEKRLVHASRFFSKNANTVKCKHKFDFKQSRRIHIRKKIQNLLLHTSYGEVIKNDNHILQ